MRENHERHPKSRPLRKVTHFIKAWRKHRKMTVEAVAERAGLTASMISQLETGRSAYTQNSLEAVAAALDVEAGLLLLHGPFANAGVAFITSYDDLMRQIDDQHHAKVEEMLRNNVDAAMRTARFLFGSDKPDEAQPGG